MPIRMSLRKRKNQTPDFGKVAVMLGFMTEEQLARAEALHAEKLGSGNNIRLGEVCLRHKLLSRREVLMILRAQGKRILSCVSCKKTYNVEGYRHDRDIPCKRCGGPLRYPTRVSVSSVSGSLIVKPPVKTTTASRPIPDDLRHLLNGYEITRLIGEGGMGTVYKARDLILKRTVAVKILSPMLAEHSEFIRRFYREAKFARELRHPNIVEAYDAGFAGNHKFFLMEFVDGKSVEKMIRNGRPLRERNALKIARQTAQGLAYAWRRNIIHRDIKPANILVEGGKWVKICDLGLTKDVTGDMTLTQSGAMACSPAYASPEQLRAESNLDCRTDTYSLGVTLYEMVTGRLPFQGSSPGSLIYQQATANPSNPLEHNPKLNPATAQFVMWMMQKKAADRPTPEQVNKHIMKILTRMKG